MSETEAHTGRRAVSRLSDAASLPVGPCPACEREVLGYVLPESPERFACVHCDGPLRRVDWVDEQELSEVGYETWDPLAGGCGTGCASGGCGSRG
ncbi:MAG: hypothetical protein P8R42_22850 [Candidatus Binatia bacterium]|nr:hypothetical protein [Candidatus Binatia bacterium]